MDFRRKETDFEEADRRYDEQKRQYDARDLNNEQFDAELERLTILDEERPVVEARRSGLAGNLRRWIDGVARKDLAAGLRGRSDHVVGKI